MSLTTLTRLLDLPGRDHARELAQQELSRPKYGSAKPSWLFRLLRWVLDHLDRALSSTSSKVPGGGLGVLLLVLLLAGLVALVVVRLRPSTDRGHEQLELFGDQVRTAREHRERAEAAAAAGQFAEAVRERLRAVVRELEARGVLDPRPGRTADEIAREAGQSVIGIAEPLQRGATVFDEVWYGGRVADAASYQVLVEVDRIVSEAKLVPA